VTILGRETVTEVTFFNSKGQKLRSPDVIKTSGIGRIPGVHDHLPAAAIYNVPRSSPGVAGVAV